jgi:DNA-binding response OmpR family regulator
LDASTKDSGVYSFGQYRLDPLRRTLTAGGTEIRLVPRAFDLLVYFVENPGRVIEKDELISAI